MAITVTVFAITVITMVAVILYKPYVKIGRTKIGLYWVVSLLGAVFMLLLKRVNFNRVITGITQSGAVNPLKILVLFLSMTLISVYLGDAGFFDLLAEKVFLKAKSGTSLFVALYFTVAVLTVFTSNDIVVLTFTPPILVFAKKAKVSPLPFLIAEFTAANTWSMALIVGNPTNIYLATSSGIPFFEYAKIMLLPTVLGGVTEFIVLFLLFRKSLKAPIIKDNETADNVRIEKVPMVVAIIHLVVCIIMLSVSYYIGVEMWAVCLTLAASLTAFNLVYGIVKGVSFKWAFTSLKKAPYELIPFVLSMFIIVLALSDCGFTNAVSDKILNGNKIDALSFGALSALSSNLLNNIPMSVLFERITGGSLAATLGTVIGSNIGAFITPVGALAGIMWTKILTGYDYKLSFKKFFIYGITVAIPVLLVSCSVLMLMV